MDERTRNDGLVDLPPNRRVIVIDDNPEIHRDLKDILGGDEETQTSEIRAALFGEQATAEDQRFQIDSAYQGEEGFKLVQQAKQTGQPYAVAFVDVRMPPGWDGVTTIKHIWEADPDVQVIVCTAYADYGWQELTDHLGRRDQWLVLKKPFDTIEAKQLTTALAEKWRLTQQARLKMNTLERMVEERTRELQEANERLVREMEERERAQAAAREKEEQLRHAQKMEVVGALAGGIAHEFNNLLQVITGYTQYALDDVSPESDLQHDLTEVLKAAEKAATLTRQLLSFGRRQPLRMANLDPAELLEDLVKLVRPLMGQKIELKVEVLDELPPIFGDANQLHQVLLNLCLNARDAMPDGGTLTLRCQREVLPDRRNEPRHSKINLPPGEYVVFVVEDTGCGMTPEVMERIFEPFFTTKDVGKGTGLGLSTAYGIVQQHKGTIHVESTPGRGSRFRIYIPAAAALQRGGEPDHVSPHQRYAGNETVLVVEDEPAVRELAVRSLQKAGYTVLSAGDGEEALNVFQDHCDEIDLVVLDMVMPKLNGREAYERMKERKPDLPAVFCTAYDPKTANVGFVESNALRLLQKPYRSEVLLKTVRACLDRRPVEGEAQRWTEDLLAEVSN